ncbi:MAG: biotin/lipoyl-containing protein, partial [Acidaminobacteraceae bacterium]
GAHILCIKDMSALLKPHKLVKALKSEISMPVHIHTHDTTGNGVSTILLAAEAGVDIVDTAFNSMSGLTSQPALNSVVAALENTERETGIKLDDIQKISDYWYSVRPVYTKFESDLKSSSAEIYKYEIPGGQYSNLKPQVESFGLGHRFDEVKTMYKEVNDIFGDIIKVTPSSKAVGDMAIFMIQNDLNKENLLSKGKELAFPDSVISYFEGMMGQPEGGFDAQIQKMVLKGVKPIVCRPGELLEDEDFDLIKEYLSTTYHKEATDSEAVSYALYPKVYEDYLKHVRDNGDFSKMGSDVFFHGLREGETSEIQIGEGKILIVKLLNVGKLDSDGMRKVIFEINGNRREVQIKDKSVKETSSGGSIKFADEDDDCEIGSSIPGTVSKILVKEGDLVNENQVIAVIEAMKMETNISSKNAGVIDKLFVKEGDSVQSNELIATMDLNK